MKKLIGISIVRIVHDRARRGAIDRRQLHGRGNQPRRLEYTGTVEITLTSEHHLRDPLGDCAARPPTASARATTTAFAAAYVLQDAIGLIVYKVMEDGTLDGLWTIAGKEGNGTEVLTPAK